MHACVQESNGFKQLRVRDWSPLARLSLSNVTLTCDPAAPPEPAQPLTVRVYDGHDYRHAWRIVADLQLPAKVLVAVPLISLGGVPLLGQPAVLLQRDTWLEPAPELEGCGDSPLVDFAFSYETALIGTDAKVRTRRSRPSGS